MQILNAQSNRSIKSIVSSLGKLSLRWLRRDYRFRKRAVQRLESVSGYTRGMAEALLDGLFSELTEKKIWRLLRAELGDPLVLDGFRRDHLMGKFVRARGPRLITHVFAGNIPNPAILSFVFGMLLKSKNAGKVSSEDAGFLDIYLDSLKDVDPPLAKTNVLIGPKDRASLSKWMKGSDLVAAYGSDETLAVLQKGIPPKTAFIGYGHRASFSLYTREALQKSGASALARKTARDIWMMDRRGCLSPLTLYAQKGGQVSPAEFSRLVDTELRRLFASDRPEGLSFSQAAGRMVRDNLRAVKQISFVRPFHGLEEVYRAMEPFQKNLQAVALEAGPRRRGRIIEELSCLGVNRICRAGQMQKPPLTWHHDGKFNLANWVTWTDLEC